MQQVQSDPHRGNAYAALAISSRPEGTSIMLSDTNGTMYPLVAEKRSREANAYAVTVQLPQ